MLYTYYFPDHYLILVHEQISQFQWHEYFKYRLDHGIPSSDSKDEEEKEIIEETKQEVELGPNIKKLKTNDDIRTLLNDHPVFVYTQQLMELASTTAPTICSVKGCGEVFQIFFCYLSTLGQY